MKYFSMFTGIGGFEAAFDRGGWECVGFSEIDPYPIKIYKYHYPNNKNYGSATTIIPNELPDFELLCGGFPCQAFSVAGKRAGFEDTRGTLFFDVARIAKEKRPRFILLENVKGLLSHDWGRTFKIIVGTLEQLGYGVQWKVFNSKNNGVPQNRERVYIFANYGSPPEPEILLDPKTDEQGARAIGRNINEAQIVPTVRASQGKQSDNNTLIIEPPGRRGKRDMRSYEDIAPTITSRFGTGGNNVPLAVPVASPEITNKRQNGIRFKQHDAPSHTSTARDRHGVFDGKLIRKITPIECERLQGFPDDWTRYGMNPDGQVVEMADSRRYKAIGNAITITIPIWIKANIKRIYGV